MTHSFSAGIRRWLPFLEWFPVSREDLRLDLIAGVSVALLLVPQAMAYADLAGLPAQVGLYAAFLPVILGALFGSCRQLSTGPVAMTSILTAGVLAGLAAPGSEAYINLALLLALLVGVLRILLGLLRMAGIVNVISHPAMGGFTNAAAMIIALSQVNKILGLPRGNSPFFCGFLLDTGRLLTQLHRAHLPTMAMGLGAILLIAAIRRWKPRWPALLIAVVIGTLISRAIGFEEKLGGQVVGVIPRGLPRVRLPSGMNDLDALLPTLRAMLPGALSVALIGFMEVVAVNRAIAIKTRQRIDLNRELIGQGVAILGAGLTQGYPISGSFSRSAMNLMCGARTGLCSVFTGLVVMLTLLFLTPLLHHLPNAILAAGIIVAVTSLVEFDVVAHAAKTSRPEGAVALVTWVATMCFAPAIERGILVGVALALYFYFRRTMAPPLVVLGVRGDGSLEDATQHGLEIDPHLPAVRFDGSLYFGSVAAFEDSVLAALRSFPAAKALLVVCDGINFMDASGEWCLRQLHRRLAEQHIEIYFAGMKREPFAVLERAGLVETVGRDHFVRSVRMAAMALQT
ncbi:MAG: SulP family inorganic anion transporter [Lentisphaeria bacterium]|nr:SulP family inorganic anion transporter [Lentisphaeria bacterium]